MERKLINWMGVLGIISLISYALAVIISPVAYPGYNWMEQAVSDLSADNAPSKALWDQLSALYSSCGLVSVTCVSVFVADNRVASRLFRTGIYLFAVMNWVSGMGYRMFPLVDAGKEIASFQEVMHIVVTALVVILSMRKSFQVLKLNSAKVAELPKAEAEILKLVAVRFMAAAGDPCRYEETAIKLSCAGETFTVKGKTVLQSGWKEIVEHFYPAKEKDAEALPRVQEGMVIPLVKAEVKDGKTKPPQHFTEGSLLHAMETAGAEDIPDDVERKGLGTPATRAGIIEKLIQRGFAVRSGDKKTKILLPTEKGVSLVTVVPEKLKSPMMTAEWEQKLLQMEQQSYDSACFMEEISAFVRELVDTAEVDPSISFAPSFQRKARKGRKR